MTTILERLELHLQRTHGKRIADFRQFQQMLEQVDTASAEMTATKVGLLSMRVGEMLKDMAELRDPAAYVLVGNVLASMHPEYEWPIVLEVDKERLEQALERCDRWEAHHYTLQALYKLIELVAEDKRLAGLVWMGFASMHPNIDEEKLNVFETSMFPALPSGALSPATQLDAPAIGRMTAALRKLVP